MDTNYQPNSQHARLNLRISQGTLSFSVIDPTMESKVAYEPYTVRSGISMAANLREAFHESDLLGRGIRRARVLLDTPVLMIPIDEYDENTEKMLYQHSFPGSEADVVLHSVLPDLNAVAVFSINKDLKLVIDDHFQDVRFMPLMQSVWSHMHQRSFSGNYRKLYAYFHDQQLDLFCYDKNRFRFTNSFGAAHSRDAVYFMLYAWKLLAFDAQHDELYIAGEMPDHDWSMKALRRYIAKVYTVNPSADFNRAPITQIKHMPFDLMTLFMK